MRPAGEWPGKEAFDQFGKLFYVITVLALLSALVLIANTMTTLVAEQTSEIGIMKAIGGRRRQIARVFVRTALMLGALGTAVGVLLGVIALERPRPLLRLDVLRGRRRLRRRPAGAARERPRRPARPGARGAPGDPARRPRRPARGARVDGFGRRRAGRVRPRAPPRRLPAAHGSDRPARHHPAQAPQPRDGPDGGARGREPARRPRVRGRCLRGRPTPPGATTAKT